MIMESKQALFVTSCFLLLWQAQAGTYNSSSSNEFESLVEASSKYNITQEKESWKLTVTPRAKFYSIGVHPDTKRVVKANWYEAGAFCRITDMYLATIESRQDYEDYKKVISAIEPEKDNLYFWTDGTRLGKTTSRREDYYWATTLTPIGNFPFWLDGEPNNHLNREQCLDMKRSTSLLEGPGLHDDDCTSPRHFVCQKYI